MQSALTEIGWFESSAAYNSSKMSHAGSANNDSSKCLLLMRRAFRIARTAFSVTSVAARGNHVQIGSTICDSFDEPKRLTKLFADLLGCGCEWLTRAGAE